MSENKQIKEVFKEIVNAIEFTQEYGEKEQWEYQARKAYELLQDNHYKWMMLTPKQKVAEIS